MQDFFFLKTNGDYTRINYSDIVYIECLKNYVRIVTTKAAFMIMDTLKHVEEILPQASFCRIHRSYIVSLNQINRFNGRHVIVREKKLPIGNQHRDALMSKLLILTPEPRTKIPFSKN